MEGSCGKSFRKKSLLDYHIKYYHTEAVGGGTAASTHTPSPAASRKRKKTISLCKHPYLYGQQYVNVISSSMYVFTLSQVYDPTVDDFTMSFATTEPCLLSLCDANKLPLFLLLAYLFLILTYFFFFRCPTRSVDQPPAPHVAPIFSVRLDPASVPHDLFHAFSRPRCNVV